MSFSNTENAAENDYMHHNFDEEVVREFGKEWSTFDQSHLPSKDQVEVFNAYFSIFPWHKMPKSAMGFDLGCGSGRWAKLVAPRVGKLHCIDPSIAALEVARKNLSEQQNCQLHL